MEAFVSIINGPIGWAMLLSMAFVFTLILMHAAKRLFLPDSQVERLKGDIQELREQKKDVDGQIGKAFDQIKKTQEDVYAIVNDLFSEDGDTVPGDAVRDILGGRDSNGNGKEGNPPPG